MKGTRLILIPLALLILLCLSCTTNLVETDGWRWKRTSFLQRVDFKEVEIDPENKKLRIKDYSNDGGAESLRTAVDAAVKAAISSVK
jgi:hypothetical protein